MKTKPIFQKPAAPKMARKTITVKVNEQNPEPEEIIAQAIIDCADGLDRLKNSRLSERAILVLLRDVTGLPIADIRKLLNAGKELRKFVKP